MIKVTVKSNTTRDTDVFELDNTPAQAFAKFGIEANSNLFYIDGRTISNGGANKTFAELGIEDGTEHTLSAIVKAEGASF